MKIHTAVCNAIVVLAAAIHGLRWRIRAVPQAAQDVGAARVSALTSAKIDAKHTSDEANDTSRSGRNPMPAILATTAEA